MLNSNPLNLLRYILPLKNLNKSVKLFYVRYIQCEAFFVGKTFTFTCQNVVKLALMKINDLYFLLEKAVLLFKLCA